MKKVFVTCLDCLTLAIFSPVLAIWFIALLFCLPMDYIRYKTSRFGREVREKYTVWSMLFSERARLYDGIRKAGLPIVYENGHFRYGNTMILYDIGAVTYREETGEWIMDEGDEKRETTLSAFAEERLAQVSDCGRAVFLIKSENIVNDKDLPEAERCEDILLYKVRGRNSAMNKLRAFIEAGA